MNLFAWDLGGRCSQPSLTLRLARQGAAGLVAPTAVQRNGAVMDGTGAGNRILHHPELAAGVSIGATQHQQVGVVLVDGRRSGFTNGPAEREGVSRGRQTRIGKPPRQRIRLCPLILS